MKTKSICFLEVREFIMNETHLYEAIKKNAGWEGSREDSYVAVIEAVNHWYSSSRYNEEFKRNTVTFFKLNFGVWLRHRIKKNL
jgi:hypothetical protein